MFVDLFTWLWLLLYLLPGDFVYLIALRLILFYVLYWFYCDCFVVDSFVGWVVSLLRCFTDFGLCALVIFLFELLLNLFTDCLFYFCMVFNNVVFI